MKALRGALCALTCALSGACAEERDTLKLFFQDELVQAPVRKTEIVVVDGATCEVLQASTHEEVRALPGVLATRVEPWRDNPGQYALEDVPEKKPLAFAIAAYDADDLQIARGCQVAVLDPGASAPIEIELRALPLCAEDPTALDLAILLDMSLSMEMLTDSFIRLSELYPRVVEAPAHPATTRFSLTTFGSMAGVSEVLEPTSDLEAVRTAIDALNEGNGGPSNLFDGVFRVTSRLRARAVCGRKQALFIVAGSVDQASTRSIEDASLGIIATRSDATDDLYVYGLAFSDPAYFELASIIPEASEVTGVSGNQRVEGLKTAGRTLRMLIP